MREQVKSKERVRQHGEVFTAEREVNAMLDLVTVSYTHLDVYKRQVNTSDILIRKFNPIPPPFPNQGKGGGSGGYTPAACRGNSTAGADRQGQAAVKRRCDAPLTARSRLYEKTGGDGGYIPPEP